jgi:hypothetical protein
MDPSRYTGHVVSNSQTTGTFIHTNFEISMLKIAG